MSVFDTTGAESCRRCGENARAEVERMQAENEKLRERVAELEELTDEKRYIPQEWYQLATTENANLRKLVRYIMHQCNDGNPRCDECIDWNDGECVALLRMRELGIEVE